MWYLNVDKNQFLISLYDRVPEIKNTRISEVSIHDEGQIVTISFDMPYFADKPPEKWIKFGYNNVHVRLDFSAVHELNILSNSHDYKGSIDITKDDSEMIIVKITGTINALIKAESGLIQSISGYIG